MSPRAALPLAAALLALAAGCPERPAPDNQGIEIYVSGEWPIVLHWSPVPEHRYLEGNVSVSVDEQRPAVGAVTLTLNGVPLPEDATLGGSFDVRAAGLGPVPPGSRLTLEARTGDGRAAAFAFDCPREIAVSVAPDPIVKGAPVAVSWSAPIFLDASAFSTAPDPTISFCNHEPLGGPVATSCSDYQTLAHSARGASATLPAYRAGALGYLVQLDVVGDVVQQVFPPRQFHQGICILQQRTAFAAVDP